MQRIYLLLLFFFFAIRTTEAQSGILIANINFSYKNEQVEITYDITSDKQNETFTIGVLLCKTSGETIAAHSFTGDIGTTISTGFNKKILWNSRSDGYVLDDDIYVKISATPNIKISKAKHLIRSVLFPGWGDYQLRNGKLHALYGFLAYGSIATSVLYNKTAFNTYNQYQNSMDISERNAFYKTFNSQKIISLSFVGVAISTWITDLIFLNHRVNKTRKNLNPSLCKYYYELSQKAIIEQSPSKHINTKTPYDLAIEKGDRLKKQSMYKDAKDSYKTALTLKPNDIIAKDKLDEVEKIIANKAKQQTEYNGLITQANSYLDKKDFTNAKITYQKALLVFPDEPFPKSKIEDINKILELQRLDAQYETLIAQADNALRINDLTTAEKAYSDALKIKPKEQKPLNQLTVVKTLLNEIEQKKIDKEFVQLLNEADIAYNKREYDKALPLYQEASNLKPSESYPKNKIVLINKMMDIKIEESKNGDLSNLFEKCKNSVFLIVSSDLDGTSQGSGFFISSDGTAITNYHVYSGSYWQTAKIYTEEGEYSIDKILDKNEEKDYIIFKVKSKNKSFPAVKIAPYMPKIGEKLFAIGNPEGLQLTLSDGIVSGFRESFAESNFYIQTTTAITHGSSGGPLFNSKGEVIGITTKGLQSGSLFFAINIMKLPIKKYIK